jgi:hypothetical protein
MNEFLIDCSFKKYSMALKFDLLIQRYAILIPRGNFLLKRFVLIPRYAAKCGTSPALCGIARDHDPALCGIARNHSPALSDIARDQHIFVNFSANSKQKWKIF